MKNPQLYKNYFKLPLDVAISSLGIAASIPFTTLIALAIRLESKGPVFFLQERVGLDGKPFEMYKFRSMLRLEDSYDSKGAPLGNYERVTKVGRFLRATSLDELPQLLNVTKGEMSLIGPRPTLKYQVERYTETQKGRLAVRPGLTGWAQVNGRNSLTWDEKIQFDLEYVKNISLKMDLAILRRTVSVILRQESVAFQKHDPLSEHETDYRSDI